MKKKDKFKTLTRKSLIAHTLCVGDNYTNLIWSMSLVVVQEVDVKLWQNSFELNLMRKAIKNEI